MIFKSLDEPSLIFSLTSEKILLDFNLEIDFSSFKLLNGSPSSINNSPRITDSFVIVFPVTFILSTNCLDPSKILICISIVSLSIISLTECSIN